jgi:hypothetical protein
LQQLWIKGKAMKILENSKLIERNKKIAQYTLYVSLALLVFGFIWSIRNTDPDKAMVGWLILLPSYFLVQISIYMANKWGKSPRPDEIVIQSLKGLNDEYTFYNYTTPVPHLLVGPQGAWILNPYHQKGVISFNSDKQRYQQKGGAGVIGKYFGQEGLPNVLRENENLKKDLQKYYEKRNINERINPEVINVFYSEVVELDGENFPVPCIKADKLKTFVRKESKNRELTPEELSELRRLLTE